jgi:hypothetical protein
MELFNFSALMDGASVKACSAVTGRVPRIVQDPGALKMPGIILSGIVISDSGLLLSAGPGLRPTGLVDPLIGAQRRPVHRARGHASDAALFGGAKPFESGLERASRVIDKYTRFDAIGTVDK